MEVTLKIDYYYYYYYIIMYGHNFILYRVSVKNVFFCLAEFLPIMSLAKLYLTFNAFHVSLLNFKPLLTRHGKWLLTRYHHYNQRTLSYKFMIEVCSVPIPSKLPRICTWPHLHRRPEVHYHGIQCCHLNTTYTLKYFGMSSFHAKNSFLWCWNKIFLNLQ